MAFSDITYESVVAAVAEHDRLGRDEFLRTYGFAPARSYRLAYGGRLYDSKAIIGVAHGYATGVLWTAKDFSGGQATVGQTLERLGFTVDVDAGSPPNNAGTVTAGGALEELTELPVATHDGRSAPYQYVVMLWAIARARTGAPRMVRLSAVTDELRGLLSPFALGTGSPDPANPWGALRDSRWWQLDLPADIEPGVRPRDLVRTVDAEAGLEASIYEKIRTDPGWAGQAVDVITRIIGDHPAYGRLIDQLGLAAVRTVTESGVMVRDIPVEASVTEQYTATAPVEPSAQRRRSEAVLQGQYADYLAGLGHRVCRQHIVVGGENLFTDLYDETARELVEVKSSVDRMTVRLALGQLLDYARHIPHDRKTVLLPSRPADDLLALLGEHGVTTRWRISAGEFSECSPSSQLRN